MPQTMLMTDHGLVALAATDLPSGVPIPPTAPVASMTQAANIGATTLLAVTTSGFYRIQVLIKRTQIATTSSTLPSVTITWTDADNSAPGSNTPIATNATNSLVASLATSIIVHAKAGTNIQYSTTGYLSSGATPMQYALRISAEAL